MIDPERIASWFESHAPALVLYARQWLARSSAEDAVQEVFVRLMLQRQPPANPKAWLYRAVRNQAISQWRSGRRRELWRRSADHDASASEPWFQSASGDLLDAETATEALEQLPGPQREAVVLRIWAGMTLQEIGELTDSPISTVFHHYQQGLAAVRQKMGVSCSANND